MILYLLLWAIAVISILVRGSLVGHALPRYFDVDFIIIILIYLFTFYGEKGAGVFAFGTGVLTDLFSGGLFGFYTLIYLTVFLVMRFGSRPLDLSSTGTQIITVFLAVFLKGILMIVLFYLFSLRAIFSLTDFFVFIFSIICSGLIAPFLFYLFNYCNRFMVDSKREF